MLTISLLTQAQTARSLCRLDPCMLTRVFLLLRSLPGALHGAGGGPEGHERQRGRLQVHYPRFCGGLHHCRFMGEGHGFAELRYDRRSVLAGR